MSPTETAVRRIAEQYGSPQSSSSSPFLTVVANLPPDRHDVAGAIFIAEEALAATDEDGGWRDTLARILKFKRSDGRYDRHDMAGILTICDEGIAAEASPSSGPRP